jgi:hypothetical protein
MAWKERRAKMKRKAIKVLAVISGVWSLVLWALFTAFTLLWLAFAPVAGSILSPAPRTSGQLLLLACALIGTEALVLVSLRGIYRLRFWGGVLLTACIVLACLAEIVRLHDMTLTPFWLAPSIVTAILFWCIRPWRP